MKPSHNFAFQLVLGMGAALAANAQITSLSLNMYGPMLGGSAGQSIRITVSADPSVGCLATAGFRKSDVQPPEPDLTMSLGPGQAAVKQFSFDRMVTRPGQRGELVPAVRVIDGKCRASAEVFENLSGRVLAHVSVTTNPPDPDTDPPEPDLPAVGVAQGQMVRLGLATPPDPDKTCSAVLAFFDANGRQVGASREVFLTAGQFGFLDLSADSLVATSGPSIAQPRLLLPAVRTGDQSACRASAQVYESMTGWTMEAVQNR